MKGNTAGIPNNATEPPNNAVIAAIIPICLKDTSFVALTILLRATPNKIKDVLIITIAIDPISIFFFVLFSILNIDVVILTIPNNNTEPNNAGTPVTAIVARNADDIAIRPVTVVNTREVFVALTICLLFFDSFLVIGIRVSTIPSKNFAPNKAGTPVTAIVVRNAADTAIRPVIAVNDNTDFAATFIYLLFFDSFFVIGIRVSTIFSKSVTPNKAGTPVTAIVARNADDIAIRPLTADIVKVDFVALLINLLFSDSFLDVIISLSIILSKSFAPNRAGTPVTAIVVSNKDDAAI